MEAAERFLHRVGRPDLANKLHLYGTQQDIYHPGYEIAAFGIAS